MNFSKIVLVEASGFRLLVSGRHSSLWVFPKNASLGRPPACQTVQKGLKKASKLVFSFF